MPFPKKNSIKAFKYAFIQAVERIVDRPIRCTDSRRVYEGEDEIEEFIRWWQLGNKEANTLYVLNPAKRKSIMDLFSPRDMPSFASQVFIAFVFE